MSIALWQTLRCKDADAMARWLAAVGFTEHATYRNEQGVIEHAEYLWPAGGGVMFGAARDDGQWSVQPGAAGTYLVTDEVDAIFNRAVEAGATPLREPREEEYGGRGCVVRDPEGNLWSFGSYAPV